MITLSRNTVNNGGNLVKFDTENIFMLDLFSGLGGASEYARECGYSVISVDIDARFKPDLTIDINKLTWPFLGLKSVYFVWASPPCTEFARESMPWCKTGKLPDISLVKKTFELIKSIHPVYWCIENVKGAIPYIVPILGDFRLSYRGHFLWGNFPDVALRGSCRGSCERRKVSMGAAKYRSKIPYRLSRSVVLAAISQGRLL